MADAQLELPHLGPPLIACRHCGRQFVRQRKLSAGRPVVFCSPECRQAHADAQHRDYLRQHPQGSIPARAQLACKVCGSPFAVPASLTGGRVPGFCSIDCKKAARASYNARYRDKLRLGPAR